MDSRGGRGCLALRLCAYCVCPVCVSAGRGGGSTLYQLSYLSAIITFYTFLPPPCLTTIPCPPPPSSHPSVFPMQDFLPLHCKHHASFTRFTFIPFLLLSSLFFPSFSLFLPCLSTGAAHALIFISCIQSTAAAYLGTGCFEGGGLNFSRV